MAAAGIAPGSRRSRNGAASSTRMTCRKDTELGRFILSGHIRVNGPYLLEQSRRELAYTIREAVPKRERYLAASHTWMMHPEDLEEVADD